MKIVEVEINHDKAEKLLMLMTPVACISPGKLFEKESELGAHFAEAVFNVLKFWISQNHGSVVMIATFLATITQRINEIGIEARTMNKSDPANPTTPVTGLN